MSREEKANIDTVLLRCRKVLVGIGLAVSLPFCTTVLKMLPVTELMNIPDATFVKSTQSSATTEQT